MAFEFQCFPEQGLILVRINGDVTLEENHAIGLQIVAALDNLDTSADVLFDLRAMGRFPTSISQLRQNSAVITSPKIGWFVLLTGDRPILKFVATVLIQLQTRAARMRVFDTLEKAVQFLKDTQPSSRERSNWFDDLYRTIR